MKKIPTALRLSMIVPAIGLMVLCTGCKTQKNGSAESSPRIVNIVNFVRLLEPRYDGTITEDMLFETVREQILQLNEHGLPATFLLQYDALIQPRYQELMKDELGAGSEIGAWWEITQPHVEAAGMTWRGKYPWDWHANVGFATGYTPQEREKLIDIYMEKFHSIFGKYPSSVGSWFIDAHSLAYMYDKYGIVASCNCKDQVGTDGYTLWGGYWNQAYYPSRKNAYMPAQTEAEQIPVPVFRMLGSDPIYQYDLGLGSRIQGVVSLEPVYERAGGDRQWVEWFFRSMFEDPALTFNYVQAGQENSFAWDAMRTGLEIQIPMLDSLRAENKIRVETLAESGKWFREQFQLTPPTSLAALSDIRDEERKTVWFNSRFYRTNLLWHGNSFRFRDIHFFNEQYESDYLRSAGTSTQCVYTTLPFVDGFLWSDHDDLAGMRIMQADAEGTITEVQLEAPTVETLEDKSLKVTCKSAAGDTFMILLSEDNLGVSCAPGNKDMKWWLELSTAPEAHTPFTSISGPELEADHNGFGYTIACTKGSFGTPGVDDSFAFRIMPDNDRITIDCKAQHVE